MKLLGLFLKKNPIYLSADRTRQVFVATSHVVIQYNYADCNLNVLKREDSNNRISDAL